MKFSNRTITLSMWLVIQDIVKNGVIMHIFTLLFGVSLLLAEYPAFAVDVAAQLDLVAPTPQQRGIIVSVLGNDFIKGKGGGSSPELLVSKIDLNGDKQPDLVVIQRAFCDNHSCEFHFLLNKSGKWKDIANISSWATPYIINHPGEKMCDIIIFDHITDDCLACSPAKPVRYVWKPKSTSHMAGEFYRVGPLSEKESQNYRIPVK